MVTVTRKSGQCQQKTRKNADDHRLGSWSVYNISPFSKEKNNWEAKKSVPLGGSRGLVVMRDDSCSRGHGFKSWRRVLDGHFFTFICCKKCIVCLKKTKNKWKRGRIWPIKKIRAPSPHLGLYTMLWGVIRDRDLKYRDRNVGWISVSTKMWKGRARSKFLR